MEIKTMINPITGAEIETTESALKNYEILKYKLDKAIKVLEKKIKEDDNQINNHALDFNAGIRDGKKQVYKEILELLKKE